MKLSNQTLAEIPADVPRPSYDRSALRPGIVHLGVGHFHRAHQALYLDDLMQRGAAISWAICGVGLTPGDVRMKQVMAGQDGLYTLTEKASDGDFSSRVVGSICDYHFAPDDPEAVIARIADRATGIVSLTITEGGYEVDDNTGEFAPRSEAVLADLAAPRASRSAFGLVVEALRARRDSGIGGLTIMSCDNVQGNGHVAATAFLGFAQRKDPELAEWIRGNVTFPNSMVDRVTPGTVEADRAYLRATHGIDDAWPVTCEPFRQWVLEDKFVAGRPPFEDVGVEVVDDVVPYELMKLRIANGVHQALCYFGTLVGLSFVHEAVHDPDINAMLLRYIDREAVPTLDPIPAVDFHAYGRTVLERFGNPQIKDPLTRICEDTSDRIPKFLLPGTRAQLDAGRQVNVSAAVVASWARYAEGVDETGAHLDVRDPRSAELMAAAARQHREPLAFLTRREIFGDLIEDAAFTQAYQWALTGLHERGARAVLRELA
ncbi:MAG: mannitol dehydrogenase family protein [Arachnia sp.]